MRSLRTCILSVLLLLLPSLAFAQTESFSTYIAGLPAAASVNSADLLYLLQSNTSKSVPWSVLQNSAWNISGDCTITSGVITCTKTSGMSIASLSVQDQTLSGGANVTSQNLGTVSSGTTTIDCGSRPLQFLTNNGAFTLAAPSNDGSCMVLTTNGASAGTISFSGFSVGSSTGDALTTTNTQKFTISIWRINGTSGYRVAAHQ